MCLSYVVVVGTKIAFGLITANATEQKVVRHFFKLCDAGQVWPNAVECDYTTDFYLKDKVTVECVNTDTDTNGYQFETFTVSHEDKEVMGVHVRCQQQAANTRGGSRNTTAALLRFAKKEKLQLEVIFCVGCCGFSADDTREENVHKVMGRVLLSDVYQSYLDRGKQEDKGLILHPQFSQGAREWVSRLDAHSITQPGQHTDDSERFRIIPVTEVPLFATGPLVIKVPGTANEIRGKASSAGLEMEASGIASALDDWGNNGHKLHMPTFFVLKGVSDFGANKGQKVKALFFDKQTDTAVEDDVRQQIATFHCAALVARGVADKFLLI